MPHIEGPLAAVVLDVAACKQTLGVRTVVEDLSAEGFSLRMSYSVAEGENVLVIMQLHQAVLLLRGKITRVEKRKDETFILSARITQHQIFSSLTGGSPLEKDFQFENKIHR